MLIHNGAMLQCVSRFPLLLTLLSLSRHHCDIPLLLSVQVQFEPNDGYYFMTAGYDNTIKLWAGSDFKLTNTLAGHEGKVMGADISPDGSGLIASVGYDRTIKLWAPE